MNLAVKGFSVNLILSKTSYPYVAKHEPLIPISHADFDHLLSPIEHCNHSTSLFIPVRDKTCHLGETLC